MRRTFHLTEPLQTHKLLTQVLWPEVKAWLICGGGPLMIELKTRTRSNLQNARLWAMLTDIAEQVDWHGRKLGAADWKAVFTASLKGMNVVPNLNNTGFVALGQSTSKMTRGEMAELQTLIEAFAADKNVVFKAPAGMEYE